MSAHPNRTMRYAGLFSASDVALVPSEASPSPLRVWVHGCGAVGHRLCRDLSSMGSTSFFVTDPDTVSDENLGPQAFSPSDIGIEKVAALLRESSDLSPDCHIDVVASRSQDGLALMAMGSPPSRPHPIIHIITVDSMASRQAIWSSCVNPALDTVIDARTSANSLCLIGYEPKNSMAAGWSYEATILPEDQAIDEPCNARMTPHTAACAASLLLAQLSRLLRREPLHPYINFCLRTMSAFSAPIPPLFKEPSPSHDPSPTPLL